MTERTDGQPGLLRIPRHWTPEQADLVFGFLNALVDAVWLAYEGPLVDLALRAHEAHAHDERQMQLPWTADDEWLLP